MVSAISRICAVQRVSVRYEFDSRGAPHAAVDGTSCTATTQDADTVSFGPPLPYFGLSPPRWLVATSRRDFGSETLQDPVCLQRGIAVVELEESSLSVPLRCCEFAVAEDIERFVEVFQHRLGALPKACLGVQPGLQDLRQPQDLPADLLDAITLLLSHV